MKDIVVKELKFPEDLYDLVEKKAKSLGLSFEKYVQNVVSKEVLQNDQKDCTEIHKQKTNRKYFLAKDEEEMREQGF